MDAQFKRHAHRVPPTPEAIKAGLLPHGELVDGAGTRYLTPYSTSSDRNLFKYQMFSCWKELLHLGLGAKFARRRHRFYRLETALSQVRSRARRHFGTIWRGRAA